MPVQNEIGAHAATPHPHVIFVRLPAVAPLQPGEPKGPAKRAARRSPPKGRRKRQEKRRMIKPLIAAVCALAMYLVLGTHVPFLGAAAVVFPALRAVPFLGAWVCFLTYKGIASLSLFSWVAAR